MAELTRLDAYHYKIVPYPTLTNRIAVKILVDGPTDPVISDIETNLINSDNNAYIEGTFFKVTETELQNIGSATALMITGNITYVSEY